MSTYRIEGPDGTLTGIEFEDSSRDPVIYRVLWDTAVRAHRLDCTQGMRYSTYARDMLRAPARDH